MLQAINTFDSFKPVFAAGQCLTAAYLNRLRDYLSMLGSALLESYSDGIIHGLDLHTDDGNALILSPGAFKLDGRIGSLNSPAPVPVDFVETRTLVLQEIGAKTEKAISHISTAPPEIETAEITTYQLSWQSIEYPDSVPDGMELGSIRAIQGQSFRNFALRTGDGPRDFPGVLKDSVNLEAGDICRLHVPYSCKSRWPTLGPDVQKTLAEWLLSQDHTTSMHLIPALLRGELPICDYTQTSNLHIASAALCRMLSHGHAPSFTPPPKTSKSPSAIRVD